MSQQPIPDPAPARAAHLRHELRTPLNHIIGYSEMLEEELHDREIDDLLPDLKKIQQAARTLQSLIERHVVGGAAEGVPLDAAENAAAAEVREQLAAVRRALPDDMSRPVVTDARLLVVDDSEENRDMLSRRLRERGYEVACAEGGREALRALDEAAFDLVLLDVMMPDVSGIEVLQTLRKTRDMSDLPVIMVTAMDRSEDTVAALRLGANDYVTKPLDFDVVLARTETQLQLKRAKERIDQLAGDLEARNAFIRATFDRYVSADIAERLLASDGPRLSGEKRTVTMLMADLRGFTTMVQLLEPEHVVRVLNRYLAAMTEVIREFGGTIDEFIGDAVLALFGAPLRRPDDALRAVACAVRMQQALAAVNLANARDGLPRLEMGVGLDTGEVIVGSIGSLVRAKYTAVGNSVNLAARIESCTVGGQVMISRSTLRAAGDVVRVDAPIRIEAKGFRDPIEVFSVVGVGAPHDVSLPTRDTALRVLTREVVLRCAMLDGKQIEGSRFEASLLAIGATMADVRSSQRLSPLQNLQVQVVDLAGAEVEGDLYCKVIEVSDETARIHFTGVHPAVERFLESLKKDEPDG